MNTDDFKEMSERVTHAAQALDILPLELAQMLGTEVKELYRNEDDVIRRMSYIIRIHDALATTYPRDPAYRKHWMHQRCTKLRKEKPIVIMTTEGDSGMIRVLSHLDCTFSWDFTSSSYK